MSKTHAYFTGYIILNQFGDLWMNRVFSFKSEAQKYLTDTSKLNQTWDLRKHKIVEASIAAAIKELGDKL